MYIPQHILDAQVPMPGEISSAAYLPETAGGQPNVAASPVGAVLFLACTSFLEHCPLVHRPVLTALVVFLFALLRTFYKNYKFFGPGRLPYSILGYPDENTILQLPIEALGDDVDSEKSQLGRQQAEAEAGEKLAGLC